MAAAMEDAFRSWHEAAFTPPPVRLLRVEEGAAILAFSGASGAATVSLAPVEGASFFAEGLEDPPDEVEEWLTDVNSYMAEKPRLTFAEALGALASRVPRALLGAAAGTDGADAEMEVEVDADDDDDLLLDGGSQGVDVDADRAGRRAAYAEDRQWDSRVDVSASRGSRQASQVLMREMRSLMALQGDGSARALAIEMVDDSLYRWSVQMHADGFPEGCELKKELRRFASQHATGAAAVVMDVSFPDSFPMQPPFIRVVRPRFQMHTGHITVGGSVCMQLLTPSGWLPSVSLENVFVSIRSEMIEGDGRIDFASCHKDYSVSEAKEAFNRVARRYGWLPE
mmetsp:Transcript_95394/g.270015  ORF Transcript_95394/g.270015 Transcript_95394/m.270015 type:complete len:340 (-) Transcript_95394:105-1124(-)